MKSNDRRTVALFGCGAWGKNIARVLSEQGALAVICDSDQARGSAAAEALKVEYASDPASVLSHPDISAVAIATPAITHKDVCLAALKAGKHVYVEKPVALSVDDATKMADAANKAGLVLMVGHLLQYHPIFVKVREMAQQGALGELLYVYSNRLNQGRIRTEEDAMWSLAPHDFSMILALAGEAPTTVLAVGQAAIQPAIADIATIHMAFANGLKAHISCSWLSPYKEHRLAVIGREAMLEFNDSAPEWGDKLVLHHHKTEWQNGVPTFVKGPAEKMSVPKGEPLSAELSHFLDCVTSGRQPLTGPQEAIPVLNALVAAEQSMRTGAPVKPE